MNATDAPLIRRQQNATFRDMGNETQPGFEETEDGGCEVVGMTPDPFDAIAERIDGPLLLADSSDRKTMAHAIATLGRWLIRSGANTHEIGARVVSIFRPVLDELQTGASVAAKYGVSKSQQAQSLKQFRKYFGSDFGTLKNRNADERRNMSIGAKEAWKRRPRKRKSRACDPASATKTTENLNDLQTDNGVEVNSGGAL